MKKYLKRSPEEVAALVNRFRTVATVIKPQLTVEVIKDDPADNRVLEYAVAGRASYIVSGNHHLLDLKKYREIVILNPAEFLTLLQWE